VTPVVLVGLFVAALAVAQVAVWASGSPTRLVRSSAPDGTDPEWDREPPLAPIPALAEAMKSIPGMSALQQLQGQAGSQQTTLTALMISLGGALLAQLVVTVLTGSLLLGVLGGMAGASVPLLLLLRGRRRCADRVLDALPRAIRSLARLARAGQGPAQAIRETALELEGPLGRELGRAFAEQRDGRSLEEALEAMADRVPQCVDLRILVTALVLASEAGGNLGLLLERIETTLSERIALSQAARAESAQARLSSGIIAALPPLGVLGIALLQPEHLAAGWEDPLGRVLYIGSAIWMSIGLLIIVWLLRARR
jgi:tight adherence protein B